MDKNSFSSGALVMRERDNEWQEGQEERIKRFGRMVDMEVPNNDYSLQKPQPVFPEETQVRNPLDIWKTSQ